jgi:RPA family protein
MISRQTAKKVRIRDITSGKWVKKEGMEPSIVLTPAGEPVARVRIIGTIVARFDAEDGKYSTITIDDGSDTIRAKAFKEVAVFSKVKVGDLVDLIAKAREYNGELYLIPEVVRKVDDPNYELLRRLELLRKEKGLAKTKELIEKHRERFESQDDLRKELVEKHGVESEWVDVLLSPEGSAGESDRKLLKKEILKILAAEKDGIVYSKLMQKLGAKETDVESVVNELLNEGICFEPSPGKIKKI